ncbi:MAG: hypothetical protein A2W99_01485 [Bacteroidetes bacterium GWF2_33_16]|nr:MAG: hypothetical protein A2X00_16670 [Bacteroidetes bacterium GWE2_32_14]OFY06944.1 MAG: hypothetical protein A2W99_01485 [Bacteroidetes bacterium GWF2_33_16]
MDTLNKRRILIGVIVLLLVINISALAAFLFTNNARQKGYDEIKKTKEKVEISGVHRYLREELKLTDEQFIKFKEVGRINFQQSRDITLKLDEKRIEFINELTKETPDDERLDAIAREIGDLHYSLKKKTINHFFELKEICNPEQQESLKKLFMKMIQHEDQHPMNRPERGKRHGRNQERPKAD